jgi:hypothetical protein
MYVVEDEYIQDFVGGNRDSDRLDEGLGKSAMLQRCDERGAWWNDFLWLRVGTSDGLL